MADCMPSFHFRGEVSIKRLVMDQYHAIVPEIFHGVACMTKCSVSSVLMWVFLLGLGRPVPAAESNELFARKNLVAWCIVPFDSQKRGPEERAQMLEKLGFSKFAYDYRAEHIPTFDAEIE